MNESAGEAFKMQKESFSQRLARHGRHVDVALAWRDVNLSIMVKDQKMSTRLKPVYKSKVILQNISGKATSGQLVAIMGPTGCGKTSLMNALAGRMSGMIEKLTSFTGEIYVNGEIRDDAAFRSISAYVLQDDRLYPHLTVFETLLMSAHFFLSDDMTSEAKKDLVDSVINELGLGKATNTIIGDEKVRGISGGERKRANIAVQLISDPAVLFLDEPTSGLDSFQAKAVMESMKNMTTNGRLVISVIHQPRSSIYDMFDQLLLLSEGKSIYLGSAKDATAYFERAGFVMPKFFNPADFFLDLLSPDYRNAELESASSERISFAAEYWTQSSKHENYLSSDQKKLSIERKNKMTLSRFFRNLRLLYWRSWTELSRDLSLFSIKCGLAVFFSCIIAGMYVNISNTQDSIYNILGLFFVMVLNQAFNNVMATSTTFPKEKVVVNRERSSGAYDTLSYFFAKILAELPLNLFPGVIFSTIIFWVVGLRRGTYGIYVLILMLHALTSMSLGLAVSAASPNVDVATGIAIPITIIPMLFGGFYINLATLPPVANWIPYASFMRWTFQALVINEFIGDTFVCTDNASQQCLTTGEDVLVLLSFQDQSLRRSVLGLACCLIVFISLAVIFLEMNRLKFMPLGFVGSHFVKTSEPVNENKSIDQKEIQIKINSITDGVPA